MLTTADYINQLKTDKATLVTNLAAKGVTATNNETFTQLVQKVTNISGAGKYTPRYISFTSCQTSDLNEEMANLDTSKVTNMQSMFANCSNLTSLNLSNFNTSNVTNMQTMFANCSNLTSLNLSNFNTSKVTNMQSMFANCSKLTSLILPTSDVSKVTNMQSMFQGCSKLTSLDLSNSNASNVTNMKSMFANCSKLTSLNLSNFNTSKVTNMQSMFAYDTVIPSIDFSTLDTSKVTDMGAMFRSCTNLIYISKIKANAITTISDVFSNCTKLANFDGFENLGQAYSTTQSANSGSYKLNLTSCISLTEQSLINILNNLYDIATKGCKTQQVILGNTNLVKLTSDAGKTALENVAIKGWVIS